MPGIYIHIPFCRQACNYCDFHFSTSILNKTEVVEAITSEIELRHNYLKSTKLDSIYFGGGTPSLLSQEELTDIFTTLSRYFTWDDSAEITLEANPDDITVDLLAKWKSLGINRLSIGLQSFMDEELRWMNRAHNSVQSLTSVKMAQDLGFTNISIDLIYGSKFQTLQTWEDTLKQAISLNTQHISSYNLTIEQKTVLGLKNARGQEPAVNDELSSRQFEMLNATLSQNGFVSYEISNFGKPGYFAVHNSNYWLQQPYLGIGPSAHSFDGFSRQWNLKNNPMYVRAINTGTGFFEKENLSVTDRYNEYVLTRLRTIWGCNLDEIKTLFGEQTLSHFFNMISPYRDLIIEKQGVITLNAEGKLRADGIASELFL